MDVLLERDNAEFLREDVFVIARALTFSLSSSVIASTDIIILRNTITALKISSLNVSCILVATF